jgi:hypothetical protein
VRKVELKFYVKRSFFFSRAFERTAQTIVHVGQQGIIASLLQLESNAQSIESCNEALTELISLFNVRPRAALFFSYNAAKSF